MSKTPKFKRGDIVWFFEVDESMDPSGWIRKCRVTQEATRYFDPIVQDLYYDCTYTFRARENQLFKTELDAHKCFLAWADSIVERERKWLDKHKQTKETD